MDTERLANALGAAGAVFVVSAGYVLATWVGLLVTGLTLIGAGYVLDGGDKE